VNISPSTIEKGIYKHSKSGRLYDVLGIALHTETSEQLVVYAPRYSSEHQLFARPYSMFIEKIEVDGRQVMRFVKINE